MANVTHARQEYLAQVQRPERVCKLCNRTYRPKRHGALTFCSRECSFAWQGTVGAGITAEKRLYSRWSSRAKSTTPCRVCSKPIAGQSQCCSEECRRIWTRRYGRAFSISKDDRDRLPRPCRECGTVFEPVYGDKRRIYCSDACRFRAANRTDKKRRRNRLRLATVEHFTPWQVFERDGWKCHLCGKATARSARVPDPKAPTLDHLVPISAGGEHSMRNVATAHFECNWKRSDTGSAQLRLLA